ncbi:MAG: glycoside hydrolase family protein [Verrucomicrobia bacterium]|nr:glycoside hydrolase family protein [Verrucomicrobiota bacterium]
MHPSTRLVALLVGAFWALPFPASAADAVTAWLDGPMAERFLPVPAGSGFRLAGYWVWCGSPIKVGDEYHLFAARWPKQSKFPDGYREASEIVRAVARDPLGPYAFQEVVIGERDRRYWDSNMAHNPTIHRIRGEFVLFYIGSDFTTFRPHTKSLLRQIGYARAPTIRGPWTRSDRPLIAEESNNPAVCVEADGAVKLMYRDADLRVIVATAPGYAGPYQTRNAQVWPRARLEDFYVFRGGGRYFALCEDNVGGLTGHERWGALLVSPDGIDGWQPSVPPAVYDHAIALQPGGTLRCVRRERPQLLIEDGRITHLFTAVYDGTDSWSQPVALARPIDLRPTGN